MARARQPAEAVDVPVGEDGLPRARAGRAPDRDADADGRRDGVLHQPPVRGVAFFVLFGATSAGPADARRTGPSWTSSSTSSGGGDPARFHGSR